MAQKPKTTTKKAASRATKPKTVASKSVTKPETTKSTPKSTGVRKTHIIAKSASLNKASSTKAAKKPTSTGASSKKLKITTPIRTDDFKTKGDTGGKPPTKPGTPGTPTREDPLRLMEYIAAIRREFEAVALIAAPEEREVPQFQLAQVDLDIGYSVTKVDDDGVYIEIDQSRLSQTSGNLIHRAKLKFVDLEVNGQALEENDQGGD